MSNSAIYGFRIDGQTKLSYCHSGGNIKDLGMRLMRQLREIRQRWGDDELREKIRALQLVDEAAAPKMQDLQSDELLKLWHLREQPKTYYLMFYETQGDLEKNLSLGLLPQAGEKIEEAMWEGDCGYLIDCDSMVFRVYRAFGGDGDDQAVEVKELAALPFDQLEEEVLIKL